MQTLSQHFAVSVTSQSRPLWAVPTPSYLPIVPQAAGYGMNTTAGSGRSASVPGAASNAGSGTAILFVSSLSAGMTGALNGDGTGHGTLSWCLASSGRGGAAVSGARTVIPLVSGLIVYEPGTLLRVAPHTTYAGQCAPSPGLHVFGANWVLDGSETLVWHATAFKPGGLTTPRTCFKVQAYTGANYTGLVYANCTGAWNFDEGVDAYTGIQGITYWQHLQMEPPYDKSPEYIGYECIGRGAICSEEVVRYSLLRCLFAHCVFRMPLSRSPNGMIADNVIFNYGHSGAWIEGNLSRHNIVSNVYLSGPQTANNPWVGLQGAVGFAPSATDARAYVYGNAATTTPLLANASGKLVGAPFSDAIPDGYTPRSFGFAGTVSLATAAQVAEQVDLVCSTAGARPGDRLPEVAAVVNQVKARAAGASSGLGSWITSCVDTPRMSLASVAQNTIDNPLSPGAHWNDSPCPVAQRNDIAGSGYTVLEEWLHQRHAQVM